MRGRPPKYTSIIPPNEDLLSRLRLDPGTRTLGQLLQEREWALNEIERLRRQSSQARFAERPEGDAERVGVIEHSVLYSAANALLTAKHIRTNLCISNSTLYRWVAECGFPKPLNLGGRAVRWNAADVRAWIEKRKQPHEEKRRAGCQKIR